MLLYKSYETLGLVVIQINCYLMTISSQQGKFRILSKKNVFIKITWWNFLKLDDFVLEILLIECYAMQNLLTWIQNYKTPVGQLLDYLECSTYYQLILCRTVCTDNTLLSVQTTRYCLYRQDVTRLRVRKRNTDTIQTGTWSWKAACWSFSDCNFIQNSKVLKQKYGTKLMYLLALSLVMFIVWLWHLIKERNVLALFHETDMPAGRISVTLRLLWLYMDRMNTANLQLRENNSNFQVK